MTTPDLTLGLDEAARLIAGVSLDQPWLAHELTTPAGPLRVVRDPPGQRGFGLVLSLADQGQTASHVLALDIEHDPDPAIIASLRSLIVDHHLLSHPRWLWPWQPPPPALAARLEAPRLRLAAGLQLTGYRRTTVCNECERRRQVQVSSSSGDPWRRAAPWFSATDTDCDHAKMLRQAARVALERIPSLGFELLGWLVPAGVVDPRFVHPQRPLARRFLLESGLARNILASWLQGRGPSSPYGGYGGYGGYTSRRPAARPRASWRAFADWDEQDSPWLRGAVTFAAQAWSFASPPTALLHRTDERSSVPLSFGEPPAPSRAPRLLPDLTPAPAPAPAATARGKAKSPTAAAAKAGRDAPEAKVEAAPKPAGKTPKPAGKTPKPASETPKPASETPKPASETPKPASETPKPAGKVVPEKAEDAARPTKKGQTKPGGKGAPKKWRWSF